MELLTVSGPLTATELADRLDETPANCSWHLRKLAEHHFVEEAGGGIGRQRPWQVRSIGLAWDESDASPEPGPRRARARADAPRAPGHPLPPGAHPAPRRRRRGRGATPPRPRSPRAGSPSTSSTSSTPRSARSWSATPTDSSTPPGARRAHDCASSSRGGRPCSCPASRRPPTRPRQELTRHEAGLPAARLHPPVRRSHRVDVRRLGDAAGALDLGEDPDRLQRPGRAHVLLHGDPRPARSAARHLDRPRQAQALPGLGPHRLRASASSPSCWCADRARSGSSGPSPCCTASRSSPCRPRSTACSRS